MSGQIAIVGMGCRFPGSPNLGAFWDTIRTGRICAGPVPRSRWNHDNFYSENGAREFNKTYAQALATIADVRNFAPEFFGITPRRAKVMDPQQRLFLDVVRMALEDAGYAVRPFPRERTGVFVGATVSDFMDILTARMRATQVMAGEFGRTPPLDDDERAAVMEDLVPMQAYSLVGSLMNMVAANVNQFFDLGGPSFTMDAACSSALVALHEAVWQLRTGLVDAAVVGGVYLILTPDNLVAFSRIGAISPSDTCRPYDGRADGFFIGEGLGAVMLRRLEDAQAAGDRIYAVIRGVASNSDGKAEGPMTPRREGQVIALERAYKDAGISARTLGYLEGHGTATPVGDATEIAAFRECLGTSRATECAVASVKGNIGHTMSAAGIAGLIKAALCVRNHTIPPQAGFGVARPELEMEAVGLYVPQEARDWPSPASHPRRAGVNAFGFGGTNVHVVLEEAPHGRRARATSFVAAAPRRRRPELVVVSAPTPALLARTAEDLVAHLGTLDPNTSLADVACSLALRRPDTARVALVASDVADLIAQLRATAAAVNNGEAMPAGAFLADAPRPPEARRVAFLFAGQGAQSPGLCLDLYQRFSAFRAELDRLAPVVDSLPRPLLSYLYPDGWPGGDMEAAIADLTATEVCQPAVAAVGLALARFARTLGLEPELCLGHSLGEFVAAAAAGLIEEDEACVRFVATRGFLIAESTGAERGVMTAVAADRATVGKAIQGITGVVLANLNHSRQVVISGTEAGVRAAEVRLSGDGIRTTRLRVSHAFHSPLMAPVAERLAPFVRNLPIGTPRMPVISAIRPGVYPADPATTREIFLEHATSQVDFAGALAASADLGANVFVQMGAGTALASMASANVDGAVSLSLAGSAPDEGVSFLRAIGQLFVLGVPLDVSTLFDRAEVSLLPMLPPSLLDARPLWPVALREPAAAAAMADALFSLDAGAQVVEAGAVKSRTPPRAPSAPGAETPEPPAADAGMAALFAQQLAMLDAHVTIIRQQNEMLARAGVEVPEALLPAASPRAVPPAPVAAAKAGASTSESSGHAPGGNGVAAKAAGGASPAVLAPAVDLTAKVIEVVARITAHPPAKLSARTRLAADLGFDSLMVVELVSGMQEALPGSEPLPRALFTEDVTIADVARQLARGTGVGVGAANGAPGGGAPARTDRAPVPASAIHRHMIGHAARPLAPSPVATSTASTLRVPVVVMGGGAGMTRAFAALCGDVSADLPADVSAGATVIDLRALAAPRSAARAEDGAGPAASPSRDLVAAVSLARRLDGARPAVLVLAHREGTASGLAGFARALAQEWPETRVLALGFDKDAAPGFVARAIHEELLAPNASSQVSRAGGKRVVPVTLARALTTPGSASAASLPRGAVVAITGGAGGLGGRLAIELGRRFAARIILMGRRPADAAVARLLADIARAGGQARYCPCDVRDAASVAAALAQGRLAFGPIQFAVHAAGVVEDAPVARKDDESARRVFDTKVAGAIALWRGLAADPLSAFLAFGSWAGCFGNAAQTDYAAANAALGDLAGVLARERGGVRVVTLHMPPWQGSGMLAKLPEAIQHEMRARGVPFLTDETGPDHVIAELGATHEPSGEFVLGGQVLPARTGDASLRTGFSLTTHPFLDDHRVNGRVVLPMASAIDLLREAAVAAGVDATAGLVLRDLAVEKGVIFAQGAGDVVARAAVVQGVSAAGTAMARLAGEAEVELLSLAPRARVAYRGRFAAGAGALPAVPVTGNGPAPSLSLAEFYSRHTFHGPRLRSVEDVMSVGPGHVRGIVTAGQASSSAADAWLLAIDGALQLCAYWAVFHHGRVGLPEGIAEMRIHRPIVAGSKLLCRAILRGADAASFEGDIDIETADGEPAVQIRGLGARLLDAPAPRDTPASGDPVAAEEAIAAGAEIDPAAAAVTAAAPAVDAATWRIDQFPEVKELRGRLEFAAAAGITVPYFRTIDSCIGATAMIDGREYINFTSYNYVGLSGHPRIADEVAVAVKRYGTSVSASRVTGGQKPIHAELEQEIAAFLGAEASLVMVGGHATNVSVIGHLLGADDLVLHDSLAHDSILGGARLAGARRRPFAHNDPAALEAILREVRPSVRRVLIAVEGVYSMDGDITPLPQIIALKKQYGALLLVDEAHSLGVLGRTGRGVGEHFGVDRRDVDIWMGTMSKTLASCGGYVAGSAALIEYLKFTTPGFIYSVGITPANAAAALTALRLLQAEPERAVRCQERARTFLALCKERGVDTGDSEQSAVVPCIVGNSYGSIRLAEGLLARGIHVHPILYPAVPEAMARLRFFVTAAHTDEQLRVTADAIAAEMANLSLPRRDRAEPSARAGSDAGATVAPEAN